MNEAFMKIAADLNRTVPVGPAPPQSSRLLRARGPRLGSTRFWGISRQSEDRGWITEKALFGPPSSVLHPARAPRRHQSLTSQRSGIGGATPTVSDSLSPLSVL